MLGEVIDVPALRRFYHRSRFSVISGFAGLSLTQSLSFGVPVLIADDEPHAPEIAAAMPGFNCRYFEAKSAPALAGALVEAWGSDTWHATPAEISGRCAETFSAEKMAEGFPRHDGRGRMTAGCRSGRSIECGRRVA